MRDIVIDESIVLISTLKHVVDINELFKSINGIKNSLLSELSYLNDKIADLISYDIKYINQNIIQELEEQLNKHKNTTIDPDLYEAYVDFTNKAYDFLLNCNDGDTYSHITSIVGRDINKCENFKRKVYIYRTKSFELREVFEKIVSECVDIKNKNLMLKKIVQNFLILI